MNLKIFLLLALTSTAQAAHIMQPGFYDCVGKDMNVTLFVGVIPGYFSNTDGTMMFELKNADGSIKGMVGGGFTIDYTNSEKDGLFYLDNTGMYGGNIGDEGYVYDYRTNAFEQYYPVGPTITPIASCKKR